MSSKPETRYEIVDVTPELASELRARQPKIGRPRTIKRANLSKIERAIRDGGFYPESNPVKVGWPSGALLDGNHRLQAVINTGKVLEQERSLMDRMKQRMRVGR